MLLVAIRFHGSTTRLHGQRRTRRRVAELCRICPLPAAGSNAIRTRPSAATRGRVPRGSSRSPEATRACPSPAPCASRRCRSCRRRTARRRVVEVIERPSAEHHVPLGSTFAQTRKKTSS
jgi:hypothetical protein